jgi:GR25 family glycosyltransferase involved in LPS biosynthesis
MSFLLDNACFIADRQSIRYKDLKEQVLTIKNICKKIHYVYKYNESNIDYISYYNYCGLSPFTRSIVKKLSYKEYFSKRALAVALNHLESFKIIASCSSEGWSMVCEDDIVIINKDSFINDINKLLDSKPTDADMLWISSGKKEPNATYKNITGKNPSPVLKYNVDIKFFKVSESRYADCVLIKNKIAEKLLNEARIYKISYPIDWEYNFWLKNNTEINSYWLQPAIIRQNPKFMI